MKKRHLLMGIRRMQFGVLFDSWQEKSLTQKEAAHLLGVSERTFRRYCRQYEEGGLERICDKRLDRFASNAVPVDEALELVELYNTGYKGYNISHFYDCYLDEHKGTRSYNWVRKTLQSHACVAVKTSRGKHRCKRDRAPRIGMMLHQDGSTHQWVSNIYWDLIVTMDDANSEIYSGFFVDEEGTQSSFRGVQDVIEQHGLFCSLYTDRGSHYWFTPEAGGKVDKQQLTQFGRAMSHLGIEMIPAYSPEARGRSERVFGTLQDRLCKELKRHAISDQDKANQFLKEVYWPKHNKRFSVTPRDRQSAFVPWSNPGMKLEDILCIQEKRIVNKDNSIRYQSKVLQIPPCEDRYHFVKAKVRVHEYWNGHLGLFHGPRRIGYYNEQGEYLDEVA